MLLVEQAVPEDPQVKGWDVLGQELKKRGHYIHEVMAREGVPLTEKTIAEQAKRLADADGYAYRTKAKNAFDTTGAHLRQYMRDKKGYAVQLSDKRWQLTERSLQRIASVTGSVVACPPEVRTVDAKSRLLLPKEFANATVTIERISPFEIRIQKAVVIPEATLPLLEDSLKPLSDRDRDFFLNLLDNPPEPTPAFLAAAARYKKRHG